MADWLKDRFRHAGRVRAAVGEIRVHAGIRTGDRDGNGNADRFLVDARREDDLAAGINQGKGLGDGCNGGTGGRAVVEVVACGINVDRGDGPCRAKRGQRDAGRKCGNLPL